MKVDVIVDAQGKLMGALVKGKASKDADVVAIRPAHPDHRMHEVDLPDECGQLSADDFHQHLKGHLSKTKK